MNERELLSWMKPDERAEWRKARRTGGETNLEIGKPACGSDGLWLPEFDDGWSAGWIGTCFDVSEGVPCVYDWHCDTDGNSTTDYRCTLREYTDKERKRDYEQAQQASRDYSAYVAETGTDPLGEFYVRHTVKRSERWTLRFVRTLNGLALVKARRQGERTMRLPQIPQYVRDYAGVYRTDGNNCVGYVHWQEGDVTLRGKGNELWITDTIEREVPRSPAAVARDLRAAARRHLKS